jgi:hypothetical protein
MRAWYKQGSGLFSKGLITVGLKSLVFGEEKSASPTRRKGAIITGE